MRANAPCLCTILSEQPTSAAKADNPNNPFIAALKCCAAQNQGQHRVFFDACEAVPFPKI
jgi:hypothetical protein